MRDILFRGKPTREVLEDESLCKTLPIKDGFVYGNLIYNDKQPYIVGPIADVDDEYCSMEWWCPVEPETVGQFTGLKDKNWFTKIFEGDIVGFTAENELWEPQYYEGTVYFCDGTFWVDCGKDSDDCDALFTIGHAKLCDESMQIIGNIHDKPELLEA